MFKVSKVQLRQSISNKFWKHLPHCKPLLFWFPFKRLYVIVRTFNLQWTYIRTECSSCFLMVAIFSSKLLIVSVYSSTSWWSDADDARRSANCRWSFLISAAASRYLRCSMSSSISSSSIYAQNTTIYVYMFPPTRSKTKLKGKNNQIAQIFQQIVQCTSQAKYSPWAWGPMNKGSIVVACSAAILIAWTAI